MTDKLKLFKVRLASGDTRAIVAPSGGDVWALTFSTAKSAQETGQIDEVLSVEYAHDVSFVILREPAPDAEATQGWLPGTEPRSDAAPPTVGSLCPQCGNPLHAWSHEPLGHQVGPVPEGTFHNHAESLGAQPWCRACQREAVAAAKDALGVMAREATKEKKFADDVAKGSCLHPGVFRGEACARCGQLFGPVVTREWAHPDEAEIPGR